MEQPVTHRGHAFQDYAEMNPCDGCSAPCCRMLLIPHPAPSTFMDLDYIVYMLGFPGIEMVLNRNGEWQVLVNQVCRFLDESTNRCTIHGTPEKPKTCVFFNPYRCWYKQNFSTPAAPDVIRLDLRAMKEVLCHVRFGPEGNVLEIPTWEAIRELVVDSASPAADPMASCEPRG
jgi:hypothetical protein